jgi:uncharacterized protein
MLAVRNSMKRRLARSPWARTIAGSASIPARISAGGGLISKDQPILLAAIHGKADFLLTGDARHFEHLYGKRIKGVLVLRPAQYFERRRRA